MRAARMYTVRMVVLSDKSKYPMGASKKKDKKLAKHGAKGANNLRASFGNTKAGDAKYRAHMSAISADGWVKRRAAAKKAAKAESKK